MVNEYTKGHPHYGSKVMTRDEHDKHMAQFDYLIRSCEKRLKDPMIEYAPRVKTLVKRAKNKLIKIREKIPQVGDRFEFRYRQDWDMSFRMNRKNGNHWYFRYNVGTGSSSLKRWQTKTCGCEYCAMRGIVYPNDWKWSKKGDTYIGKPRLTKIEDESSTFLDKKVKDGYAVFHDINFECIIRHYIANSIDNDNPLPSIKRGKVYLHNGVELSSKLVKNNGGN